MSHLAWRKWCEARGSCGNWGQWLAWRSDRSHYNHQCGHEKIFHTAWEGLLESRAQKSVSGRREKGPSRLLSDIIKHRRFHFYPPITIYHSRLHGWTIMARMARIGILNGTEISITEHNYWLLFFSLKKKKLVFIESLTQSTTKMKISISNQNSQDTVVMNRTLVNTGRCQPSTCMSQWGKAVSSAAGLKTKEVWTSSELPHCSKSWVWLQCQFKLHPKAQQPF